MNILKKRKAKCIELGYHHIRLQVKGGSIELVKLQSDKNPADGFTKPLDNIKFKEFRVQIGVHHLEDAKHQEEC